MIWMQTGTNRAIDMMAPSAASIDLLHDVADALARLARFVGQTPAGPYSVAQHMCLGTDAILAETGSLALARAFHLHDAHEFICGDIITPTADALAARVGRELSDLMPHMRDQAARIGAACARRALAGLKSDLDAAVYSAAGHPWPLAPEIAARVKEWDIRMLATERAHLLGPPPQAWSPAVENAVPVRLKGRITVWPWPKAADEWRIRLLQLFPHLAPCAA